MATLVDNRYGKAKVRVIRVFKGPNDYHKVFDFDCRVLLRGEAFSETYLTGDNSKVVATDTTKNTIYVVAQKEEFSSLEEYGILLGKHFLATYSWVSGVEVNMRENQWRRLVVNGKEHGHSFQKDREIHSVVVTSTRGKSPVVVSGIDELLIMKTTQSGFEGFHRDQYTSLKETKDRIFATVVTANWTYNTVSGVDYNKAFEIFKQSVFDIFATTYSRSVQETLFLIAKDVISKVPEIEQVHLSLPNKHAFGFDFSRLNLENNQTVFQPVEEPSGLIEGTIKRVHARL